MIEEAFDGGHIFIHSTLKQLFHVSYFLIFSITIIFKWMGQGNFEYLQPLSHKFFIFLEKVNFPALPLLFCFYKSTQSDFQQICEPIVFYRLSISHNFSYFIFLFFFQIENVPKFTTQKANLIHKPYFISHQACAVLISRSLNRCQKLPSKLMKMVVPLLIKLPTKKEKKKEKN